MVDLTAFPDGGCHQGAQPNPSSSTPISEIAEALNAQIEALARDFLGPPNESHSTSSQLRYGKKGSIAIEVEGPQKGNWYDHEESIGGDGLELICHQLKMTKSDALEKARQWLGKDIPKTDGASQQQHFRTLDPKSKVSAIIKSCTEIAGTPAEKYLRNRGITVEPPSCIKFRPNAAGKHGALVALSTDADGNVLAVQQIYVTDDGTKAPVKVVKRTNKAEDGWSKRSAVRFPGTQPIIICEGVETGLSIWQATDREVWVCLGLANLKHAPVPADEPVVIARDGDQPGGKADKQVERAARELSERGNHVIVAKPEIDEDCNDVLVRGGNEAVKQLITQAASWEPKEPSNEKPNTTPIGHYTISIGSDVEIAKIVLDDLNQRFGKVINTEGDFFQFNETHWEPIEEHVLRIAVHEYDGAQFVTPNGTPSNVKLGKSRVDSVLNECAALCAAPFFFSDAPNGINCASGFIRFNTSGQPTLEPHKREHRCRHTLSGRWQSGALNAPPDSSLLLRLLTGVFKGDDDIDEKIKLCSEMLGAAALGYATRIKQPKAIVLYGQTAENGKSQILDLARGLLPASAICTVPAARMGDERHIVGLVGKLLNATDELSADAISSDTFKAIVTGEPVEGRDVYKSRVEFRSMAQNIFATNDLPSFKGGFDRGVQRRLLVIPFNRKIPKEERIDHIGQRIAEEESDYLLAFAVAGASRLIEQSEFTIPDSSRAALNEWLFSADPVLAWVHECAKVVPIEHELPCVRTSTAFKRFQEWAVDQGFNERRIPGLSPFVKRINANVAGIEYRRKEYGGVFYGLAIASGHGS